MAHVRKETEGSPIVSIHLLSRALQIELEASATNFFSPLPSYSLAAMKTNILINFLSGCARQLDLSRIREQISKQAAAVSASSYVLKKEKLGLNKLINN